MNGATSPSKRKDVHAKTAHRKRFTIVVLGATIVLLAVLGHITGNARYRDPFSAGGTRVKIMAGANETKPEDDDLASNASYVKAVGYVEQLLLESKDGEEATLGKEEDHEPYASRWQRRFASSRARGKRGGYLFLRHMRKAGGTSLRAYLRDVLAYHNITRTLDDWRIAHKGRLSDGEYHVQYVEHEFQAMDWRCPAVDPRWRESLSVIVLRHPVERHLSEFFFSGSGSRFYPIDKGRLRANETYRDELATFMDKWVPRWMKGIGQYGRRDGIEGQFNMIFGRFYTDNFQLRALAGCSSGDCLEEDDVGGTQLEKIDEFHPSSHSYSDIAPTCTMYFRKADSTALFEVCAKPGKMKEECSALGCDGPCFYPTVAWGKMEHRHVARAVTALKAFDAVLLMETLNDPDQSSFLSDVLGVPPDAEFSLARRKHTSNTGIIKENRREISHFYRDLLVKLGLDRVSDMLHKENELEIELFLHAAKLNEIMIDRWKKEKRETDRLQL